MDGTLEVSWSERATSKGDTFARRTGKCLLHAHNFYDLGGSVLGSCSAGQRQPECLTTRVLNWVSVNFLCDHNQFDHRRQARVVSATDTYNSRWELLPARYIYLERSRKLTHVNEWLSSFPPYFWTWFKIQQLCLRLVYVLPHNRVYSMRRHHEY